MSLLEVSREEVRAEVESIKDERVERARFEEGSQEEREAQWKALVDRVAAVIDARPGRRTPYDGKYNAYSQSAGIPVEQVEGVATTLSFGISHEQERCRATEYDDAGARYIQAFSSHTLSEDRSISTPSQFVTIQGSEYVMGACGADGYGNRRRGIAEFTAALGLAEAAITAEEAETPPAEDSESPQS